MKVYFCHLIFIGGLIMITTPAVADNVTNHISAVYQEGYVFDEPVGNACVKWGNYIPDGQKESVEEFRARWTVPNGKNVNEDCDSSKTPGECQHPMECISNKCQCKHNWSHQEHKCEIRPGVIPQTGPGCIDAEDCVELTECLLQYPCHCSSGRCNVVYGICLCKHPVPPRGFRGGRCERGH